MLGGGIHETHVALASQMANCELVVLHNLEPYSMPSTAVLANTPTAGIFVSIRHTETICLRPRLRTTCMHIAFSSVWLHVTKVKLYGY